MKINTYAFYININSYNYEFIYFVKIIIVSNIDIDTTKNKSTKCSIMLKHKSEDFEFNRFSNKQEMSPIKNFSRESEVLLQKRSFYKKTNAVSELV